MNFSSNTDLAALFAIQQYCIEFTIQTEADMNKFDIAYSKCSKRSIFLHSVENSGKKINVDRKMIEIGWLWESSCLVKCWGRKSINSLKFHQQWRVFNK